MQKKDDKQTPSEQTQKKDSFVTLKLTVMEEIDDTLKSQLEQLMDGFVEKIKLTLKAAGITRN